jgi:hypothetical protein
MLTKGKATAGVSVLVAALIAAVALATEHIGRDRAAPGGGAPTQSAVVTIDPVVGETFTPETFPSDAGYLSADAAWEKWSNGKPLPDSISAMYGRLTLLTGPEGEPGVEVKESGTPVWAFQEDYCIGPIGGPTADTASPGPSDSPSEQSPSSSAVPQDAATPSCTTWTFLNAISGDQIDTYSVPNS